MESGTSGLIFDDGMQRRKPIEYVINDDGCWICTSHARDEKGYTKVSRRGISERLHRISYSVHKGKIGRGRVVLHSCDNPNCFNPDHLSAGTQKMNMRDMVKKGRHRNRYTKERETNGKSSIQEG